MMSPVSVVKDSPIRSTLPVRRVSGRASGTISTVCPTWILTTSQLGQVAGLDLELPQVSQLGCRDLRSNQLSHLEIEIGQRPCKGSRELVAIKRLLSGGQAGFGGGQPGFQEGFMIEIKPSSDHISYVRWASASPARAASRAARGLSISLWAFSRSRRAWL